MVVREATPRNPPRPEATEEDPGQGERWAARRICAAQVDDVQRRHHSLQVGCVKTSCPFCEKIGDPLNLLGQHLGTQKTTPSLQVGSSPIVLQKIVPALRHGSPFQVLSPLLCLVNFRPIRRGTPGKGDPILVTSSVRQGSTWNLKRGQSKELPRHIRIRGVGVSVYPTQRRFARLIQAAPAQEEPQGSAKPGTWFDSFHLLKPPD